LAYLTTVNPLAKHFYETINGSDVDYILYIDLNLYYTLDIKDRRLLICHELEYASVDLDKPNPYKLRGAEVETFYDELERTKNDPQWHQRLQDISEQFYTKDK